MEVVLLAVAVEELRRTPAPFRDREKRQHEGLLQVGVAAEGVVVVAALDACAKPAADGPARQARHAVGAEVEVVQVGVEGLVEVVVEPEQQALAPQEIEVAARDEEERGIVAVAGAGSVRLEPDVAVVLYAGGGAQLPAPRGRRLALGGNRRSVLALGSSPPHEVERAPGLREVRTHPERLRERCFRLLPVPELAECQAEAVERPRVVAVGGRGLGEEGLRPRVVAGVIGRLRARHQELRPLRRPGDR